MEEPNMSGKPNSCDCGIVPTPHSHLDNVDDGNSYPIRPDLPTPNPINESKTDEYSRYR